MTFSVLIRVMVYGFQSGLRHSLDAARAILPMHDAIMIKLISLQKGGGRRLHPQCGT